MIYLIFSSLVERNGLSRFVIDEAHCDICRTVGARLPPGLSLHPTEVAPTKYPTVPSDHGA